VSRRAPCPWPSASVHGGPCPAPGRAPCDLHAFLPILPGSCKGKMQFAEL
jgi:hypothetical protein